MSKSAKEAAKAGLAELAKRVPPNQAMEFKSFQAKHHEYQARVNKNPEKLPKVDWDYYRRNVRPEATAWVDEFQKKYQEVCQAFNGRSKRDYSKYYEELEKVRCEMQAEVDKFKCESNERIQELEEEYARLKSFKPYEDMTAEEYSELLPEKSMFMFEGRPSFWPHTPEEQSLERSGHGHHGDEPHDGDKDDKKAKKAKASGKDGSGKGAKGGKGGSGSGSGGKSGGASGAAPSSAAGSSAGPSKSGGDKKSVKAAASTSDDVDSNDSDNDKEIMSVNFDQSAAAHLNFNDLRSRVLANKKLEEEIERAYLLVENLRKKNPELAAPKK